MRRSAGVTALILAGGAGRRMGGRDKGWIAYRGRPMIQHTVAAIAPQVEQILISANRHLDDYRALGYPVLEDEIEGGAGPLAGIARGLSYADTPYLQVVPVDVPAPPLDLVERLRLSLEAHGAAVAVAHDGVRLQPLHCLCHRSIGQTLAERLAAQRFKVADWISANEPAVVDFSDVADRFLNINNPKDLEDYTKHAGQAD